METTIFHNWLSTQYGESRDCYGNWLFGLNIQAGSALMTAQRQVHAFTAAAVSLDSSFAAGPLWRRGRRRYGVPAGWPAAARPGLMLSGLPNWSSNLIETPPFLVESCRDASVFSDQDWWNVWMSRLSFRIFVSRILRVDYNPNCLSRIASLTNIWQKNCFATWDRLKGWYL